MTFMALLYAAFMVMMKDKEISQYDLQMFDDVMIT